MIIADFYVNMNVADAVGTVVTTGIMANGTVGTNDGWTASTTPMTGVTVAASQRNASDTISIGGVTYAIGSTSKSVAFDHAQASRTMQVFVAAGHRAMSVGGFLTFGPPNAGGASTLFDYWVISGDSGGYVALQLNNGRGGAGYSLNIESDPGGVTTHSAYLDITPGAAYWCTLLANFTTGVPKLSVFDASTGAQVGATITSTQKTGQDVLFLKLGNNEIGTAAGSTSYFQHTVADYTSAVFPLAAPPTTNPRLEGLGNRLPGRRPLRRDPAVASPGGFF